MTKICNTPINHTLNKIMPVVISVENISGRKIVSGPKIGLSGVALHGNQHSGPVFGGNSSAGYLSYAQHLNNFGKAPQCVDDEPARVRLGRMLDRSSHILCEPIKKGGADRLQSVGLLANGGKSNFNPAGVVLLFIVEVDGEPSGQDADNQRNETGDDTGDFHVRCSGSANVKSEPRSYMARSVLLGARFVTCMIVGSTALLGSFFILQRSELSKR